MLLDVVVVGQPQRQDDAGLSVTPELHYVCRVRKVTSLL